MNFETLWPYLFGLGAVIVTSLLAVYFLLKRRKKGEAFSVKETLEKTGLGFTAYEGFPFKVQHSVAFEEAKRAREELRMLALEREILSDAIRRLYEAHAEGKITEEEREKLSQHYKERMMKVRDAISKNESIVALHELESMQEDLIKLFNERFDELNSKIEELRSRVEIKPIKEIAPTPISTPTRAKAPSPTKKTKQRTRKKRVPKKTEAEKRIEHIRAEIEKVLERLGQMEIEA